MYLFLLNTGGIFNNVQHYLQLAEKNTQGQPMSEARSCFRVYNLERIFEQVLFFLSFFPFSFLFSLINCISIKGLMTTAFLG